MKTMTLNRSLEIFDNYINGNLTDFKKEILSLSKANLLHCIDNLICHYGYKYDDKDILRIFLLRFIK